MTPPSRDMDADRTASRYFLPYQQEYILDESQLSFIEKSVRIGWTYADSFKNVRKRLHYANRDYLFATKDWPTAIEYVQTCMKFVEVYNRVRSVISHGEDTIRVPVLDKDGKETAFTEEVKIGYIKFDNGSRIIAFTSNPAAMQAYGGDVGLDEFAKHANQQMLYATAQGRVTWGYDLAIWSAHWGDGTLFCEMSQEARAGKGPWEYYRKVTLEDAVSQGLVEKINEVAGKQMSREGFIADARKRARTDEIYQQEYMCNPVGGKFAIVDWPVIQRCKEETTIERLHFENHAVIREFGEFHTAAQLTREASIAAYLKGSFQKLFSAVTRHSLGFDVAASGDGDLACIYVDEVQGDAQSLAGLLTCRTEDWHFLRLALWTILRNVTAINGCGDETGLGRQICWETAKEFVGRFTPVNFRGTKHDMGFELMVALQEQRKRFPAATDHEDIARDFYALRKTGNKGKWTFSESRNPLNEHSHCDMAWAGALSLHAMGSGTRFEPEWFAPGPNTYTTPARRERTHTLIG
ncbi:hypothetical protein H5P28_00275 [Ruficoccus amylovorans]|uniref:Terminase n=1 Tax=Ruficoccus amylovorans TaxID=1804625 RepID=A0A842HAM4_9BACT|nr:terminase family protein [Ruficoccus amylovorans]MBC2592687.1 hypothetical protein [Ruficoccus amylovorans]